jgi:hypothetical protein
MQQNQHDDNGNVILGINNNVLLVSVRRGDE